MKTLREVLSGVDPVAELRALEKSGALGDLEPAVAELRMPMIPGTHHKDNLEHSIRVLGNAIAREEGKADLILRTAALLHDVGKPATRKADKQRHITFDGHEHVGARMVRDILPRHGYSRREISLVSQLVSLHMRSHGFRDNGTWTDSALRRLISDVGDSKQLARLIIIFYADVTTKSAAKAARIAANVDILAAELDRVRKKDERAALRPALTGHEVAELFNMSPGRELGAIMKFLNSEEGITLTREEAIATITTLAGEKNP